MAPKLVTLEEAAQQLGITTEQLMELRDRGEAYGIRDAGSWKFKASELTRLENAITDGDFEDFGITGDGSSGGGEADSILLSEQELGSSNESTSSTIIGAKKEGSDLSLDDGASEVEAVSDLDLELDLGDDSSAQTKAKEDSSLGSKFEDLGKDSDLDLDVVEHQIGSDLELAGVSELELGEEGINEDEPTMIQKGKSISDSTIDLTDDDDDDLVLGGGPDSDITLGASDSGINLGPTESGLSLDDDALDLAGSQIDSFELGEDTADLSLEDSAAEGVTELQADDDFLLTPMATDDADDSGSQVIALDDEDSFAEAGFGAGALTADDAGTPAAGAATFPTPEMMAPALPEAPFSIWNVLSLFMVTVLLLLTGMVMFDLIRNMWQWDQGFTVNKSLADTILKWFK